MSDYAVSYFFGYRDTYTGSFFRVVNLLLIQDKITVGVGSSGGVNFLKIPIRFKGRYISHKYLLNALRKRKGHIKDATVVLIIL